jgi:tetratricopeptide (TPR) repeat protein
MAANVSDTYSSFPPYQQALKDLQAGKWVEGLAGLAEVEKKYPLDTELRTLRQEMQVRARIDEYEIEERKAQKQHKVRRIAIRVLLVLLVVLLVFVAISTYSGWLQNQWNSAQDSLTSQMHQTELAVKFLNAQQLLQAGQTGEALTILEEITSSNPDYPGLNEAMDAALAQKDLETQYTQAMDMLAAGNSQDALPILQMIDQQSPQYRDVALQIQSLESLVQMDSYLAQADQAFEEERWEDAIAGYESLRLLDPGYKPGQVEPKLFQAYINAATAVVDDPFPSLASLQTADRYFSQALSLRPQDREAVSARTAVRTTIESRMVDDYIQAAQDALVGNADSLAALATAETLFSRALELRPNDPAILVQYQLAEIYLSAVESFAARDYDAVIEGLEYVVGLDENYANGTARQTLYEAYIGRGMAEMAVGDYEFAILDFQKAATLAQQTPDAVSTYFEAQILIAEAEGMAGNFLQAILLYQNALSDTGLRETILNSDTALTTDLQNAEANALAGNYSRSFQLYRTLLRSRVTAYDNTLVVSVKTGDYLTSLARQYNTTVSAILAANNLTNQDRLDPNTELIIPILP